MRKLSVLIVLLLSTLQIVAQTLQLTVEFSKTDNVSAMKMYVAPMRESSMRVQMEEMNAADNKFSYNVETSPLGFYGLVVVKSGSQFQLPLYIPVGTTAMTVRACLEGENLIRFIDDTDNESLSKFALNAVVRDRKLWTEKLTNEELRTMFGDYVKQAENAYASDKTSQVVKDYLKIWSYVSTYNAVASLPRVLRLPADSVPFKCMDVLPEPTEVLDGDLTIVFNDASNIIMRRMPEGKLMEQIDWLRANYQTESLLKSLETAMLEAYLSKFNYWLHFDEGLLEIQRVVEKYGYDKKYVEEFEKFSTITKGAPFPKEVVLKDVDGNVVDFSKFKGKYVYIDVWASWCVPCCKEVPVLQKLESELKNENVVFVSISVDSSEAPWKKKMTALNMHGNQLWDSSKNFNKIMNIKGIPHFLVYDKDGGLYIYDAPRPSAGEGLRYTLEDLK